MKTLLEQRKLYLLELVNMQINFYSYHILHNPVEKWKCLDGSKHSTFQKCIVLEKSFAIFPEGFTPQGPWDAQGNGLWDLLCRYRCDHIVPSLVAWTLVSKRHMVLLNTLLACEWALNHLIYKTLDSLAPLPPASLSLPKTESCWFVYVEFMATWTLYAMAKNNSFRLIEVNTKLFKLLTMGGWYLQLSVKCH